MRQHCTDGSFRFCRWRAHIEALSEDSGPEALSTQGPYFALQDFYTILQHIAGELSANCCRTITMTRYRRLRRDGFTPYFGEERRFLMTPPDFALVLACE